MGDQRKQKKRKEFRNLFTIPNTDRKAQYLWMNKLSP